MGPIGIPEMMAIFVIALLLFGPKKLPELGRTLGKGLSEFRRAKNELKSTFETHMRELERETQVESYTKSLPAYPDYSSPSHPYSYDETGHVESSAANDTPALTAHQVDEIHGTEQAALPAPAVEGVVPRSNGVHSLATPAAAEEEHHA